MDEIRTKKINDPLSRRETRFGSILKILKVQKLKGLEPGPEPTPPDVENIDEKPSEGYFPKL